MARYLKLSDSDISDLVGRRASGREGELIEAAFQIMSRAKGSYLTIEHLDDVLRDLSRHLVSGSVSSKISYDLDALYEERQGEGK